MNLNQQYQPWLLFAMIFCFCNTTGWSKRGVYDYRMYDSRQGLPSSFVERLFQTDNGVLWIGHSLGISRFDGYQFKNYDIGPDQFENYQIEEDREGNLWVKSNGQLYVYNGEHFIMVSAKISYVCQIYFDEFGVLWVAGKSGIYKSTDVCLHKEQLSGEITLQLELVLEGSYPIHTLIEEDGHGGIFVAKNDSLFQFSHEGDQILLERMAARIRSLEWMENGQLLMGSQNGRIYKLERSNKDSVITEISQHDFEYPLTKIEAIDTASIWIHKEGGLIKFDISRKRILEWISIYKDLDISRTLHAIKDRESGFWFATTLGLLRATPPREALFEVFHQFSNNWKSGLFSLIGANGEDLILGGNHNLVYSFDKKTAKLLPPFDKKGRGEVFQLYWDHYNYLWVVTGWAGIKRWNGTKLEDIKLDNDRVVLRVYEDDRGVIWIGTQSGILRFQNRRSFKGVEPASLPNPNNMDNLSIKSFASDDSQTLWIGTDKGLYYFDSSGKVFHKDKSLPLGLHITKLAYDQLSKKMWIATLGQGLLACQMSGAGKIDTGTIEIFSKMDGLLTDYFVDMTIDGKGGVWLASFEGISSVRNYEKNSIIANYPLSKDWFNECFPNIQLYYHPKKNEIFGATLRGLFSFKPDQIKIDHRVPESQIMDLIINDTHYPLGEDAYATELHLETGYYNFQIVTNVKNITDKTGIRYQYLLERNGRTNSTSTGNAPYPNIAFYRLLGPGRYKFAIRAVNASGVMGKFATKLTFIIDKPLYHKTWFILSAIFSILGLFLLITLLEINKRKKKAETEKENIELQLGLLEEKQVVQRLKTNPHFVSNALSAIQYLIRKGKVEESIDFLNKFHSLQREMLDITSKPLISLEKEVELLEHYIALENLRFGGNINYSVQLIECEESKAELLIILIPQFIVQPFVENAITHGLMYKTEGLKKLDVKFWIKNEKLICLVEDNGIGRKAAQKFKKIRSRNYVSQGLAIVQKRLEIISKKSGQPAYFEIQDLGSPETGTKVKIVLPSDLI